MATLPDRREVALAAAATLAGLLFAEGLLRLLASPPQRLELSAAGRPIPVTVQGVPEGGAMGGLCLDTPRGKRLRPDVDGLIRNHDLSGRDVRIRTNSLGFRGPEIDFSRRPRLLFLGDSITLADYLDERDTFVARIHALSGGRWETINAGVGAIGVDDELAILEEHGTVVRPDFVVLDLYLNDVEPSPAMRLAQPPRWLWSSWLAHYAWRAASITAYRIRGEGGAIPSAERRRWRDEVARRFPPGGGNRRESRAAFNGLIVEHFDSWGAAWSEEAQRRILATVERIQTTAEALGAGLAVAIHPVSYQVEARFSTDEPQRAFGGTLAARGVPVLDLLPALRAAHHADPRLPLFYDNCHHTARGAEVVAQALHAFLAGLPMRRARPATPLSPDARPSAPGP